MSDKADQPQTVHLPPEPQPDTVAVAAAAAVIPQNYQDVPPPVYEAGNEGWVNSENFPWNSPGHYTMFLTDKVYFGQASFGFCDS